MHPARLDVDADLDVTVGAAHLRVRGSGPFLDVHLPAPWHWPALARAARPLRPMMRTAGLLRDRGDVRVRLRYGPFRRVIA